MYPRITSFRVYFKDDRCTTWARYMKKGAPGIVRTQNCFICFRWYILVASHECGIFFEVIPTRVTSYLYDFYVSAHSNMKFDAI